MSSFRSSIPVGSHTLTPAAEIVATLDVTTGFYVFDSVPVHLLKMDASSVYFLDQLTIAANIDQSDFFNGVNETVKLSFISSKSNQRQQNFSDDFSIISIQEPIPISNIFYSLDSENILVSFSGSVKQQIGMIDLDKIVFRVSAVVQRVTNQKFVNDLKRGWGQ